MKGEQLDLAMSRTKARNLCYQGTKLNYHKVINSTNHHKQEQNWHFPELPH
jgi:hypothetical protein